MAINDYYTVEKHFEDTIKAGRFINDTSLVWKMAKEVPKRVFGLANFGINLKIYKGYVGEPPYPGCSIIHPLFNAREALGVKSLPNTMVVEIVEEDGEAIGAIAFLEKEGGPRNPFVQALDDRTLKDFSGLDDLL